MACFRGAKAALLGCALLFLHVSVCSSQRDCTGVDCPELDNCIEEVLESGSCCTSCLHKGCTCEGYQYYDCISAGFKNGKVPEGDSYFVDYGSTECSCPLGGGRISCNFISCPDLPPNCIDVLEPVDGCMHCERIGCVHGGQKYEAGHSFHIDPCRVCHCPNEGGELMCYPVPECDPERVQKPMLSASEEDETASRPDIPPHRFDRPGHTSQFSAPYHHLPNGNLPLFKQLPPFDKEEAEDYDYDLSDLPDAFPQTLVFPTETPSSNKVISTSGGSDSPGRSSVTLRSDRESRLELRERHGVHSHPVDKEEATENPPRKQQSTNRSHMDEGTTASWQSSQGLMSAPTVSVSDQSQQTESESPLHTQRSLDSVVFPLDQVLGEEKQARLSSESPVQIQRSSPTEAQEESVSDSLGPRGSDANANVSHFVRELEIPTKEQGQSDLKIPLTTSVNPVLYQEGPKDHEESLPDGEEGVDEDEIEGEEEELMTHPSATEHESQKDPTSSYKTTTAELGTMSTSSPEEHMTPTILSLPATTTSLPRLVNTDEGEPSKSTELHDLASEDEAKLKEEVMDKEEWKTDWSDSLRKPEGPDVSADDLLHGCCAAGHRWFTERGRCDRMPTPSDADGDSICSVAQKQCCHSLAKESQCQLGMTSARRGDSCEVDQEDQCAHESYQVCCSCCALGLRMRDEGWGCTGHQYLSYPCSHVFLTCCEDEGEETPSQVTLKRRQQPRPTPMPVKVSDGKFPKEAFSIGGPDDAAANVVEEHEDVDECRLYSDQPCQHECVNVPGSYRCECHRGYVLQPDRHSCAPVSPDEDNGLGEDRPAAGPTQTTSTTGTTSTTTAAPVRLNPCTGVTPGSAPCSQRCTAVSGLARCSCFPGFSLLTDGRTCEDVDECVTDIHSCRPGERCVNTQGSFVCEPQVTCPAGYRLRSDVCEDVDECALQTHDCGVDSACENTAGSFLCNPKNKCISGFQQDFHGNCIDVNECGGPSAACGAGFSCVNTVGSFSCQRKTLRCSHGFHAGPDGDTCVDTDECQTGTHRCGTGQICHNLPGSYRCDCQTGYQIDALSKVCTDVNECWRYPGRLCAQTCENTAGSYRCSCTAGFSLALDGKNCEDVNECERNPCGQECANIYGSYQCYCRQGYHLREDGHTCDDIDECSQSLGNLCSFKCINVDGSYQCSCPPTGYSMSANGRTCRDVDECATQTHNCSFSQSCFNLQGGFRCLAFDCPHNYRKVSDTRCERTSCPSNALDCPGAPLRISYYQLSFQTNIIVPAQIFRIGPSPAYAGDHVVIAVVRGNEDGYFGTRKLNGFTGAVFLQRPVRRPRDFLIEVEMKLLRQGAVTSFLSRIYVFITGGAV